jgi:hypothetical protein
MTSQMDARTSAAARYAPRQVRPATSAPANRAAGAVRLPPRLQLPMEPRDRAAYGQYRHAVAGPSPRGHTPA